MRKSQILLGMVAAMLLLLTACGARPAESTTAPVATTWVAPSTTGTTAPITTSSTALAEAFSQEALDYFVEIAFGAEFGDADSVIRKWEDDIRIGVFGEPGEADLEGLATVIADLNFLIGTISIDIVDTDHNVEIHLVPEARFAEIEPNYVPGNSGFFWLWWDAHGYIFDARILISTTGITQAERSHLIREELTQVLGLMNDSWSYPDSIFYQGWTDVQVFSDIDVMVIKMLYLPEVEVGMQYDEAAAAILGY